MNNSKSDFPQVDLTKYLKEIRLSLLIRRAEQKLLELFDEGKLYGTVHTCIGQEFIGVSVARSLQPQDKIFSNHRCHGHFLSYRQNLRGLFAEIMGRKDGICGGRGGSQHIHEGNFFSNGIQGGIVPVAAGLAYGQKLSENNGIVVVYIGDGTLGQGVIYETMNIASKWELPLLIVCENNLYAQSTPQEQNLSGDIEARGSAFGIQTAVSDSWHWQDLLENMEKSIDKVRNAGTPLFHQVNTYRLMAHSKGDDIRSKEEIESYKEKDPLNRIMEECKKDPEFTELQREVDDLVATAADQALQSPYPVFVPKNEKKIQVNWEEVTFQKERVIGSIRDALDKALETRSEVIVMGEDIESPYGGAFKCTKGLSEKYPGRVCNTPISESAITGIGNGLALSGYIPVVEIMFGDFLTLVTDQWINHAAKFYWMYNEKINVPLIIRTPMGGRRGYGSTHSQCIEKHFLGVPGTQVLALHHRFSPAKIYEQLFESIDRPTMVIENKVLYGRYASSDLPGGYGLFATEGDFPIVNVRPDCSPDLTMVAIGGISLEAEEAMMKLFEEEEIVVDLFLPIRLYPFTVDFLLQSLKKSEKLLVVEEGQGFVSIASEILAQVSEKITDRPVKCKRVSAEPTPIPTSRPMEAECLPSVQKIIEKAIEVCNETI